LEKFRDVDFLEALEGYKDLLTSRLKYILEIIRNTINN